MLSVIIIILVLIIAVYFVDYFYKPVQKGTCLLMDELKLFKSFTIVYPQNIYRGETLVKKWTVAVTTAEPDFRYESHAAWMLHIMLEHTATITDIAELEHREIRQAINSYKVTGIDNRKVTTIENLKKHE